MLREFLTTAAMTASLIVGGGNIAQAQGAPIDCSIILCLAGGWPASAECTKAKAVFIARITPVPVVAPVQPWNCPMIADAGSGPEHLFPLQRLYQATVYQEDQNVHGMVDTVIKAQLTPGSDFSGSDYDFIRTIRVWQVRFRQSVNKDGECRDFDNSRLGTYGHLMDYAWTPTRLASIPARFGLHVPICNGNSAQSVRAVVVEWESYEGVPGFEVVNY